MSLLTAAVRGDLRAAMEAEVRDAARAMRRGVERAGREVQAELRAQARAAGFSDRGRAVANAWRLSLYPPPATAPCTLRPAALVWTKAWRWIMLVVGMSMHFGIGAFMGMWTFGFIMIFGYMGWMPDLINPLVRRLAGLRSPALSISTANWNAIEASVSQ